jgi:Rrf2 family protein
MIVSANSRLTVAVHALAWIALVQRTGSVAATSERIAASVNTNPVVIRRLLGSLRRAGIVNVERGSAAGWTLAREAEQISLASVLDALEPAAPFALHASTPSRECPVARGIGPVLERVYGDAEAAMRRELEARTVADVLRETLASERREAPTSGSRSVAATAR